MDDDHDQRFKTLIQEFLPEFIDCFFQRWYDRFDFTHVEWLEQEAFLDPPGGEQKIMDLVAQVRTTVPLEPGTNECLLLIHIEVDASNSAANLRRRMLQYYSFLRRSHSLPVLPVALFLHVGLNGISRDTYIEMLWDEPVIRFDYYSIGLPALDGLKYANGSNLLGLALSSLMQLPKADRARFLSEGLDRIVAEGHNDWRKFLLAECFDNYITLGSAEQVEYQKLKTEKQPMAKAFVTGFERKAKAIADFTVRREVARRHINKKFGGLTAVQDAIIEELSVAQLDELIDAIHEANQLSEIACFAW